MVIEVNRGRSVATCRLVAISVALVLLAAFPARAEVSATIDRAAVDLNESFLLKLTIDASTDLEPDFSVLDENFSRDTASTLSNTTIVNGTIRRSLTWSVPLMAKKIGVLEIPAIAVGNEKSTPLRINVNEPMKAPPGEADVFVTSEVDQTESYVQAQILYRIKVYRAVATRQPALREPTISGAESLIELAGEERAYQSLLDGKAYNVVERVIAIYPQESGEISISPARFEARVLRDGRITGRKVFESDPHTISVLPIPTPPAEFPNAVWLPARDVTLQEDWSRPPNEIKAGEPVTRHITVSALGQIETQIPAILPPEIEGLNVYADKPELSRRVEAEGIRGIRKDQYAMIGVRGGDVEVPAVNVPWFDLGLGEWKVATLPARTLQVEAEAEVFVPAVAELPTEDVTAAADATTPFGITNFWQRSTEILAGLWLVTLLSWWWTTRSREHEPREPLPPPVYKQQAKFVKLARKAATDNDKAGARAALLEWAALEWPEQAPRSIGDMARRVAAPASDELQRLSALSYGRVADEWDGKALADAIRNMRAVADVEAGEDEQLLPPLMP